MDTIEERFAKILGSGKRFHHQAMLGHTLDGGVHDSPNCEHCNDIRAAMLAVLEEVEGAALATADIAVNEFFVEDAIVPLRAQIKALGAPQPQDHAEPPQEEGA